MDAEEGNEKEDRRRGKRMKKAKEKKTLRQKGRKEATHQQQLKRKDKQAMNIQKANMTLT